MICILRVIHRKLQKNVLKIYELDPVKFLSAISMASSFKKDRSKIRIINSYWYAING